MGLAVAAVAACALPVHAAHATHAARTATRGPIAATFRTGLQRLLPTSRRERVAHLAMLDVPQPQELVAAFTDGFAAFAAGPKYWDPNWANSQTFVTATSALAACILGRGVTVAVKKSEMPLDTPYKAGPATYDPIAAEKFYADRFPLIVRRLARLAWLTSAFNVKLLLDWRLGQIEK
eukprot:3360703-Pleurochrysis_carterae.AAC.2